MVTEIKTAAPWHKRIPEFRNAAHAVDGKVRAYGYAQQMQPGLTPNQRVDAERLGSEPKVAKRKGVR